MESPSSLTDVLQAELRPCTAVQLPRSPHTVCVSTFLRRETVWAGEVPPSFRTVPNNPPLAFEGEVLYPEFILVRLLERHGWAGVWVNTWRGGVLWRALHEPIALPTNAQALFQRIEQRKVSDSSSPARRSRPGR